MQEFLEKKKLFGKCLYIDCLNESIYGNDNEIEMYCEKHKEEGMIKKYEKSLALCQHGECIRAPSYNYYGTKRGRFCKSHKLFNMINVKRNTVSLDQPKKNYKLGISGIREKTVIEYITYCFPYYNWKNNKSITTYNFRPDLLLELDNKILIVEIDERQHSNYLGKKERKRIELISQSFGEKIVIVIRFNPDDYNNKENKYISSCWYYDKEVNKLKIRDDKLEEWGCRLGVLKNKIEECIVSDYDVKLKVIKLYYNQ